MFTMHLPRARSLQLAILPLQFLQAVCLLNPHAAVSLSPFIIRGIRYAYLTAYLRNRLPLRQQNIRLTQFPYDLLRPMTKLLAHK